VTADELAIHRPLKFTLDGSPRELGMLGLAVGTYALRLHIHYHQTGYRRREGW